MTVGVDEKCTVNMKALMSKFEKKRENLFIHFHLFWDEINIITSREFVIFVIP